MIRCGWDRDETKVGIRSCLRRLVVHLFRVLDRHDLYRRWNRWHNRNKLSGRCQGMKLSPKVGAADQELKSLLGVVCEKIAGRRADGSPEESRKATPETLPP